MQDSGDPDDSKKNQLLEEHTDLMILDEYEAIPNTDSLECPICLSNYDPGEAITLRNCLHSFCRPCLENTVRYCEAAEVMCPYRDDKSSCESILQQREVKQFLDDPEAFKRYLTRSLIIAENEAGQNSFHCQTPDCSGWCFYDSDAPLFDCPICEKLNCLICKVIHENKSCGEYQEDILQMEAEAVKTSEKLQDMVKQGEAMACPQCGIMVSKISGCDWMCCTQCKMEICWATKGPRWGPGGKGDNSGGCRCLVNERKEKCHPQCHGCFH